ncbi:4'-phosphopantetheinyl transferase [Coemansia reversa NRRL 1564]|uniref:4'-phosphopantetheinyl transferase n=1 Tax=Coemansia reversa (strain ATCC 12441 / NRRL 1564) TaxID=763665 RepID=A0A2G5B861_COERN|nr:4'-phosphopantetheinyl transferase [Coemansia reversa NRRL 1564]|eukprot:PIA15216.1 4'-phosphopantetheinyl transferase [Coemansia reversa NRRL 1564]
MIMGVGVDILYAARIEAIVRRGSRYTARFARRILSQDEISYFQSSVSSCGEEAQVGYLALRWCLKEAIYKAAYPHQVLRWCDVQIFKKGSKPEANVNWIKSLADAHTHISFSHDQGMMIGYAIIEVDKLPYNNSK